jgi:hypothetical protein
VHPDLPAESEKIVDVRERPFSFSSAPKPLAFVHVQNITDGRKLSQAWKTASTIAHDNTSGLFLDRPRRPETAPLVYRCQLIINNASNDVASAGGASIGGASNNRDASDYDDARNNRGDGSNDGASNGDNRRSTFRSC